MLPPFRWGLGGRLGGGAQWMSWIALRDYVALADLCIARDDIAGPVNFVGPAPVTNAEFTMALARVLGRPTFLPVPRIALEVLFGEMADDTLLASQRVLPARALSAGFRFTCSTVESALRTALAPPTRE